MYLLYTDETNLDPSQGDFFVYGGIAIPGDKAGELSERIEAIRTAAKIPPEFVLKFNPSPEHLKHPEFLECKRAIIQAACEAQCVFLSSIFLHAIAENTGVDQARRFEINRVGFHFNSFLNFKKDKGIVLVDRFSDNQIDGHLREKFSIGLTGMPYSARMRLGNILGFHYSAIGQSHFTSLIDILMGSLRFAINSYTSTDEGRKKTAQTLLTLMSPLFFRYEGQTGVPSLGINFSPSIVKAQKFRDKYNALKAFFEASGIVTSQEISEQRRY